MRIMVDVEPPARAARAAAGELESASEEPLVEPAPGRLRLFQEVICECRWNRAESGDAYDDAYDDACMIGDKDRGNTGDQRAGMSRRRLGFQHEHHSPLPIPPLRVSYSAPVGLTAMPEELPLPLVGFPSAWKRERAVSGVERSSSRPDRA